MDAPPAAAGLVVVAVGQKIEIAPDTALTLERMVNDSRCPANAQCVWAGEVRVGLVLQAKGETSRFELATMTASKAIAQGYQFELLSFAACPVGTAAAGIECASLRVDTATAPTP